MGYIIRSPMVCLRVACLLLLIPTSNAYGECIGLVKGPVILDVKKCVQIQPEKVFQRSNPDYLFIYDLPAADRKKYLDSYRGLYLTTKVQASQANKGSFDPTKGALTGESINVFIPPKIALNCGAIQAGRLSLTIDEQCCDGAGTPPCLLDTSYLASKVSVVPKDKASGKFSGRPKPTYFKAASVALKKREYRKVVDLLDPLDKQDKLELYGLVMLGVAYRQLDICRKAYSPLSKAYKQYLKKQYWIEDRPLIRQAVFLHARCLAKDKKVGASVEVLQSMLFSIDLFQREVSSSLNHPDLGWIRTSKEYLRYKKAARKKLNSQ